MRLRWTMFAAWGIAGAATGLSITSLAFVTLPVAIVLIAVLVLRAPREAIGLVAGVGATVAVIGALNLDYTPCARLEVLRPGQTDFECGGFDGAPWLAAGLALIAAAVLVFLALRRGRSVHVRH